MTHSQNRDRPLGLRDLISRQHDYWQNALSGGKNPIFPQSPKNSRDYNPAGNDKDRVNDPPPRESCNKEDG